MARTVEFYAEKVSATASGDYYQLYLGPRESEDAVTDPIQSGGPYVLVQRQFEFPEDDGCYFETENEELCGHFSLCLTELSTTRLSFDVLGGSVDRVGVSFTLPPTEFDSVRRIAEVIFDLREPEEGDEEDFDSLPRKAGEDDAL